MIGDEFLSPISSRYKKVAGYPTEDRSLLNHKIAQRLATEDKKTNDTGDTDI